MTMRRNTAFTLIELLVVISIIALLISILLPALRQARTVSQMTVSMANLNQLTVAHHLYAADNRQSLAWLSFWDGVSSSNHPRPNWAGVLHRDRYVTSRKVFWGPARDTHALDLEANYNNGDLWWYTGYGLNIWASPSQKTAATSGQPPINLDHGNVPGHSTFLLMAEWSTSGLSNQPEGYPGFYAVYADTGVSTVSNMFTYAGAAPHAYVDGHASSVAIDAGFMAANEIYGQWIYISSGKRRAAPWYWEWWLE